jgi:hypothetical protein
MSHHIPTILPVPPWVIDEPWPATAMYVFVHDSHDTVQQLLTEEIQAK